MKSSTFSFFTAAFAATAAVGVLVGGCANDATGGSCTEALTAAEVVIQKQSDALTTAGDAINSFVASDLQGIYDANDKLRNLTSTVGDDAENYRRLAAECRGN